MPQVNFPNLEKKILKFWKDQKIFEKSLQKESSKGDFVFYDGPPFATGTPHYGHIVASLIKDMVPRYWTMRGYHVERKWGWDCHGLPIENIVEEEMNLKSKKDIEELGIEKFNEACRSKVLLYAREWRKVVDRLGRWVDMDNDYKTMDLNFMESVWWVFKELWDKKLIYNGYKSLHICPRCETTLSQSEITQGYKDVEDISVIAKFELSDKPGTFILSWTTTPWTLPGNVALAIGEHIDYIKVKFENEYYILAKNNLESIFVGKKYEIIGSVEALDLEGKRYKPLFDYFLDKDLKNKERLYTIQLANFVTIEDGTGVVHIAPAFGEDDLNLGQEKNLSFIQHLGMDGHFTEDMKDFAGLEVKPKNNPTLTDKKIIEYLKNKGLVFKEQPFIHSYPHCWRCESPLLNYSTSSWFIDVTKIKKAIIKNAENIHWVPSHIKEGRFGKWLEGAHDWSISRQRFWGSVIPIWVCDKCGEKKVFGSIKELEKNSGQKIKDLHKHYVDKIEFKCPKCDGLIKRVPDVLDCWFESGSMPYAQMHYPFENKEKFETNFPAKFIAEGVDQTRCWFYYLNVLSTALRNREAFKNVIANGIVLAEDGKKMSKRLNNYPEPREIFDKYGADAVRYYLATSPVMKADDLCFSEEAVGEIVKKVLLILFNVFTFYKIYIGKEKNVIAIPDSQNILDRWIIAKIELLKKEITDGYNQYDLNRATRPLTDFINELSTWYLRRTRERLKGNDKEEKMNALKTLKYVFLNLSKLMAPAMSFIAEYIYQEVGNKKESVHLEDWPDYNEKLIDRELLEKMELIREIANLGLKERAEVGIPIRQPLEEIIIKFPNLKELSSNFETLIKDELNIEKISYQASSDKKTELNTKLTPELKRKGLKRELIRQINNLRKSAGLTIKDKIIIYYQTENTEIDGIINDLLNDVIASRAVKEKKEVRQEKELNLEQEKVWIGVEK